MSSIKRLFLVVIVAIILLTTIIFPASALDSVYQFNCADPSLNGFDGYAVVPMYCSNSYIPSVLVAWKITPILLNDNALSNGSDYIIGSDGFPTVSLNISNSELNIDFSTTNLSNDRYFVSYFLMYNGDTAIDLHGCGVFDGSNSYSISHTINQLISSNNYPNKRFGKCSYFGGISQNLSTASGISNFTYTCAFGSDVAIYEKLIAINSNLVLSLTKLDNIDSRLNTVINHFVNLLSKVDYTNEQLDTIVSQFTELIEVTNTISVDLGDFVYIYWDTFANYTFPDSINAVIGKLEQIRRLLAAKGEVEQTTVNSDKVDEFADIEQSLVNNEEAQSAISDFDISIDGDSFKFIWQLVTRIFDSHPEVFGLVITILTLGFLALILNR